MMIVFFVSVITVLFSAIIALYSSKKLGLILEKKISKHGSLSDANKALLILLFKIFVFFLVGNFFAYMVGKVYTQNLEPYQSQVFMNTYIITCILLFIIYSLRERNSREK